KQETTNSFNFGSVIQILKNLSFEVDYWKTSQENMVTQAEMRNIFLAEKQFGNGFLNGYGINVIRNGVTGKVDRIVNPSVNLASLTVSGLDFRLMYNFVAFSDFRFRFGVDHSLLFSYLNEPFPGLGEQEQVGFAGIPYWRN